MSDLEKELYYAMTNYEVTNFSAMLFRLIMKADPTNKWKLHMVYPEHVEIVNRYQNEYDYWKNLCKRMKKEL